MATKRTNVINKHTESITTPFQYEFGGPIGTTINIFMLPLTTYLIYLLCNEQYTLNYKFQLPSVREIENILHKFVLPNLFNLHAFLVYLGWYLLNVVLYYIVPCHKAHGTVLPNTNNKRLQYPINGWNSMWIAIIVVVVLASYNIVITPTYGYDHFLALCTSAIIVSFTLATYLYVSSHIDTPNNKIDSIDYNKHPALILAKHGNSGNIFYDYWIGRTLNPRIFGLDLKYFNELRPGLVLWLLLNASFAYKQHITSGLTVSMILVNIFEAYYVLDALYSEEAILSTMDITTDGFGFMLAFGDLAWVPFIYSLQARYLVFHPTYLSIESILLILAVKLWGYYIFRGSNNQKNVFRTNPSDPSVANLDAIPTVTGSKLLVSGWWGYARHINYFGDILMALAWCLPTGFEHPITYFYFVYFIVLLVHRERRDDHKCHQKYGKDWEKYCALVPYRIVPYIY